MSAVVMLHGWGTNPAVFEPLVAQLARRHVTHVPQLPGYGRPTCARYSAQSLADTVARSAPQACAVVGWSMGAEIALAWARSRPRQVERIALIAGTPCFVEREGWTCAMARDVFDSFARSLSSDPQRTLERFSALQARGDVFARRVLRQLREISLSLAMPDPHVLEEGLALLRDTDMRRELTHVVQPVLAVHGARDALVPVGAAEALASALRDARLCVLSGAGHAPMLSAPRTVAKLLMDFLDAR